jgi:enterochelin esterase-like enzyme
MMQNTDFSDDFLKVVIPYVDKNYRTLANANNRAMAGLSMGGGHTIQNGLTHPELFHYIGIFSITGGGEQYEKDQLARISQRLCAAAIPVAGRGTVTSVPLNPI